MDRFEHIFRFYIMPLLSLAATVVFMRCGLAWYWLIPIWLGAFAAVSEMGCSSLSMMRPGLWVGIHLAAIAIMKFI